VALKRARCEAVCQYEKSFDRVTRLFYYVHIKTGQAQWTKPLVLGNEDVPDPPDEWRTVRYEDPENGTTCTYYENLKTGQKSWLSEDTAARMAQRQFRKMQSRALLGRVDMQKIVHAVKFTQQIQTNFSQDPDKLCNMVNYALLCHCILFDHVSAKRLYQQAVETSPHHPVICRALGLFIMSQCDDSMDRVVQESSKLFQAASEADPDHSMFQSAIDHFFSWAIVLHPKNPNAILNWALLNQMVLGDYKYADKMYRLALSVSPEHDEALRKNYDFFESQRYPGGLYASGGPPSSAVSRSRLIEEREEWGEWKKRRDPFSPKIGFEILWFNTLTKQMQFDEPRWREVWEERVKRSTCRCKSEKGLWSEYYDPLLRRTFYYSKLTDEYVCQQPHQITFIK
jgi:tetratricopeptide (TPR) repeat protein